MANINVSLKQLKINRNQQISLAAVAITVTIVVLTTFFSLKMYARMNYQTDVIACLDETRKVIVDNGEKLDKLTNAYNEFNKQPIFAKEAQQRKLPNTELVLRALPYSYDKDWTQTAWERFIKGDGFSASGERRKSYKVTGGLPGTSTNQGEGAAGIPGLPNVQALQFSLNLDLTEGGQSDLNGFLKDLDTFIQPVKVLSVNVSYDEEGQPVQAALSLETYVQPPRELQFKPESISDSTGFKKGGCSGTSSSSQTDDAQDQTPANTEEQGGQSP